MNEVKSPKKPLIYYYSIVMLILMLFNLLAMPWLTERRIHDTDYGTFISMAEKSEIGMVEIQTNQILFTDKAEKPTIYRTGLLYDPGLVERLNASGAEFSGEIIEKASPLKSFLFNWILPMIFFIAIGQLLSRQMVKKWVARMP